jgi:Tfp pilus assembly protein PilF
MRIPAGMLFAIACGTIITLHTALPTAKAAPLQTAQTQSNSSISGTVFDSMRRPIPDLWIELKDEVDSVIARVRTDTTGRYAFYRLSNGVFLLKVVTAGTNFASEERRITLVPSWQSTGTRSVNEQADFHLKPVESPSPAPQGPGTIFVQDVPDEARLAFEKAVSLLEGEKNSENGRAQLSEALKIFPNYFQALERMGIEYARLGQHEQASEILKRAIAINPKGHDSFYALGVAQFRLKKYIESQENLRIMLGLAPRSPNAPFGHYFLGMALLRGGKPADAEPHLERAYELGGKNVPTDVHMALAQIYSNTKRYRDAIKKLELYLKETPDAADADRIQTVINQLRSKL